ncbi:hypothetical protein D9M69_458720 [compost metagenome]
MRIALQVDAVLEGARLAFIDIHGHQARCRLLLHDAPFAAGGEARAAQAAQAGIFHRAQHGGGIEGAVGKRLQQAVAAACPVRVVIDMGFRLMTHGPGLHRGGNRSGGRSVHGVLPDQRRWRFLATADAGRGDHAHAGA